MPGRNKSSQALLGLVLLCCTAQAAWGQATLSLTAPPCVNTNTLVVNMDLVQSTQVAVGAQVFLQYDNLKLQFVSADPGDAPFTFQVFESVNTGAGTIDYAVGIASPGTGVTAPPTRTMARFTFTILPGAAACSVSNLVSFRATGPNGALNKVSDDQVPNQSILPLTRNNLPDIRIDPTAPSANSTGPIDACYDTVAEAEAAALANSSATDNCTAAPVETVSTTGTCNATVTVSFTDECGNVSTIPYTTKIDGVKPTITCPANITVTAGTNQCDAVVNYPAPTTLDNCDPAPVVTCSIPSGSVFVPGTTPVSCTAMDSCGNISDPCSFNVTVNLLPTTLTLASTGCQPNGQLVVDINMSNACKIVVGGQYFLQYDTARLQFVSADPGDAPFTKQVFEFVNTGLGTIDYATGIPDGGTGTSASTTMARITFNVLLDDCSASGLVTWRPSGPGGIPNRLSDDQVPAQPVLPLAVVNLPSVTLDITDPVITGVPANTTVQCDAIPSAPPTLPASDNCDLSVTSATLQPDQITAGSCTHNYTITRTWTATDACGNTATATQIITVQDTTAPSVDPAPGPVTISCEMPLPVAPPTLPASDNCDLTVTAATLNADQITPGSCAGNYVVTRTWTATDACSNSTTRTQIITVQDITLPTINCPPAASVQCPSLVPAADFVGGTATDNCGSPPVVTHVGDVISSQTCANRYTITRTYKATDDCGNFATCDQTITVNDTTAPSITCPAAALVQCANLVPVADFVGGSASDNCGGTPSVTHVGDVISSQTCANRYTITRTYKATDVCGNFATCDQTIIVNDTTAPSITCPGPVSVQCASLVPASDFTGGSTSDNCGGIPTVTHMGDVISNQTCANRYTITRTYKSTDECGNFATCDQTITVNDTTVPVITLNGPGTIHIQCNAAPYVEQGATWTDNCDGGPFPVTNITYTPSMPTNLNGTYTAYYNVTDSCGNAAVEVTRTIIIENPVPTCNPPQPLVIPCKCSADCVPATDPIIAAWLASAIPVDGCDNDAIIVGNDAPACFPAGVTTTVTWTVTDRDNAPPIPNTCSSTVTVEADTTAPTITCPGNVTVQCPSEVPAANFAGGTATDVCDLTPTVIHVGDAISAQTCPNRYTITRTYQATDDCNNSATCEQIITVNDTTAPSITCPGAVTVQCASLVPASDFANGSASDNCGGTPIVIHVGDVISAQTCPNRYTITRTYQATDACGNTATCDQIITVNDTTSPTATQGLIGSCYQTVAAANAAALAATTGLNDNCAPAPTKAIQTPAIVACSTSIVVRVSDACGNFTDYTYLTRVDNTPPVATSSGPIAACYPTIAAAMAAALANSSATDNCPGVLTPTASPIPDAGCAFDIFVDFVDSCGNTSNFLLYNTRIDNLAPTATQGSIAACYQNVADANAAALAATTALTDNCDVNNLGGTISKFVQTSAAVGCMTSVVIRVQDFCGLFTDYTYNTRVDGTPPTATQGTINACYQTVAAANAAALAATTALLDNCDPSPAASIQTPATVACSTSVVVRVTDSCGNFSDYTYLTRVDNTAPTATQGTINTCYQTVAAANAAALAATTALLDNCDPSPSAVIQTSAIEACTTPIIVRVSDSCGNFTDYTYNTRVDGTAPIINICPSNISVHAAAGSCSSAPVTYGAAAASDNCTASPIITFSPPSGSTFGPGTHTVTVTATDECGNFSTCTFTVTNDGQTEVSVSVELGGGVMANGAFTRGITFALWNTGVDNVNPLFTTCVTMNFSGDSPAPKTATATFLAPCQPTGYDCITGRDRLHTLRRTISAIPITGLAYTPSFTGAKALIGGNLNDDRFIDIIDFGIYTTQDLTVAPGGVNTVCGQNPPFVKHADINGTSTGVVNSLDYSFIATNFLMTREANCNGSLLTVVAGDGGSAGRDERAPVTSISVVELHNRGLGELAVMDLNHDGVFNLNDKQLWDQGVRPTPIAPTAPVSGKSLKASQRLQPESLPVP